jgi:hypothetical protein
MAEWRGIKHLDDNIELLIVLYLEVTVSELEIAWYNKSPIDKIKLRFSVDISFTIINTSNNP